MYSYALYFGAFSISILMSQLYQNSLKPKYREGKILTNNNKIHKRNFRLQFEFIWIILIITLPVNIATFRYGIGTDYYSYESVFMTYGYTSFIKPMKLPIEYGYYLINFISGVLFKNFAGVLFISSFITMIFVVFSFRSFRYKISLAFALFIFYMTLYPATYNGIRQMIAVAIVMYSYNFITDRKFIKFALLIVLASLFHKTALICIPWYILGSRTKDQLSGFKRYLLITGLIAVILLMPIALNFASRLSIFQDYFTNYSVGSNAKILKQLILILPVLLPIIFMSKKLITADKRNEFYIFLFLVEIVFVFLGAFYEWGFRLTYYAIPAQCILIPSIVSIIKDKKAKLIMIFYFISFYIIYFIYVFGVLQNDGIFPYQTIFR